MEIALAVISVLLAGFLVGFLGALTQLSQLQVQLEVEREAIKELHKIMDKDREWRIKERDKDWAMISRLQSEKDWYANALGSATSKEG